MVIVALTLLMGQLVDAASPEGRGLAYLSVEVPRWALENRCHSCHNDGDGARVLFFAEARGLWRRGDAAESASWLARPEGWDRNGGGGPASDPILARIQFASALRQAIEAGATPDRAALATAATQIAADQAADGSWAVEPEGQLGSPTTYGRPLAAVTARDTLIAADAGRFRGAIDRANRYLRAVDPTTVDDAAVSLLAGAGRDAEALESIRLGEDSVDGWGPRRRSPAETFDTALVVVALERVRGREGVDEMIRRGRQALIRSQSADGSWVETTRPPGGESYAQRLSTTGWATQALLESRPR